VQQILIYIQEGLANVWERNILEDLELEKLEFTLAVEFLAKLKKKFRKENDKLTKIVKFKQAKQDF